MNKILERYKIPFKILKTIMKVVSDLCVLLIFLYLIFFIPLLVGYKMITVNDTDSDAKEGSLLYYQKVDQRLLQASNLIVYQDGESYKISKIHRVEASKDNSSEYSYLIEMGESTIQKMKYSDIIGKVAEIQIPYIGFYINYINNHKSLFYIIIGIVVIDMTIGNIILSRKRKIK